MSTRRRWLNAKSGVVTLEFALLGPAIVGILLLTLETGFLLYAQTALDFAAHEAARTMATGQATASNQSGFQSLVFCPFLTPMLSCTGVSVVLQPVTDFQSGMTSAPASKFAAGASGSLMLLQATYTPGIPLWPLNVTQLVGTAAYWNEF